MLQLDAEQARRLRQIQVERDTRRLSGLLAQRFPEIAGRLGQRQAALFEHAVKVAGGHGLTHSLCLARYLACWFMLGAEFENRAGHEWARAILVDPRRTQGAKVFQLCRRTSETLARLERQVPPAPVPMKSADFDAAVAALDVALVDAGLFGTLVRGGRVALGQACDIDAVDLRLATPGPAQPYVHENGQWRRSAAVAVTAVTVVAAAPPAAGGPAAAEEAAPGLPPRLSLLSRPPGGDPTRLRLRLRAASCCDPQVHPLVTLAGAQRVDEWRGALARDITMALHAAPAAPATPDALQPAIAVDRPVQVGVLALASCGLRDGGIAMGDTRTELAVYPGEQHLMAWQREAMAELAWTDRGAPDVSAPPVRAPARCRIECDGQPVAADRWEAGLRALDRQLMQGLARLFTAWQRESGVTQPRLECEPAVMTGTAGLSWGYVEGSPEMTATPYMRVAGHLELVACRLGLRLGGEIALDGAASRISLQCHAETPLSADWLRGPQHPTPVPEGAAAHAAFRHPFVLHAEALVQEAPSILGWGPVAGALVGDCGLRPRPDGNGLQWFARLAVEPVSAPLHWFDPVLGQRQATHPLLPALDLVDWTLG